MLKLLIIDKDIIHEQNLFNYISKNNSKIRVQYLVNNLSDGINILRTEPIAFVLINLDDDVKTITNQLKSISSDYIIKYKKSMILLSNRIDFSYDDYYIHSILPSNSAISTVFEKISRLAKTKFDKVSTYNLTNKINNELEFIGYNLSYNGTKYLCECIAFLYNNSKTSENLNKNIYPVIAKKYNKTVNNVKCNITSATYNMFYNCDEERLKNYFCFYTASRPNPKLVMFTVLNKITK